MRYLQEGAGEITKEEFEAILGPNIKVVQPTATEGYVATVEALEVTALDAHTSCLVYLDVGPPSSLNVIRQNAGYLEINDWKHEGGRHFCPVEIGGGAYDAGAGETGPFTVSLGKELSSFVVSGIGWKAGTNHQHPNLYVSLRYVEGPEPPPEPPPDPPPVTDIEKVKALIMQAQALWIRGDQKLNLALGILIGEQVPDRPE